MPNKEQEFRYIKCAPRCAFYIPELWFLIGPEDG